MAPPVVGAREMRRLPGAGLGIDTDSEIRVYDILDADADSNGPGSSIYLGPHAVRDTRPRA